MKAKLIFDLSDREGDIELRQALKGRDLAIAFKDLENWLRNKTKYEDVESITIEEISQHMYLLIDEYDLERVLEEI